MPPKPAIVAVSRMNTAAVRALMPDIAPLAPVLKGALTDIRTCVGLAPA